MPMPSRQLDLFDAAGRRSNITEVSVGRPRTVTTELDDAALVAAIAAAARRDCQGLAAEAGRRRLASAVPALEALCRRFAGLGRERAIAEQTAAFEALAAIGGTAAAAAAADLIVKRVIEGPGLGVALAAAARLGVRLPDEVAARLLRASAAEIRAGACGCVRVRPSPAVIALLIELLADADRRVAYESALALGPVGHTEARPILTRLLREMPSPRVIEAAIAVADEECLVLLGRLARTRPDLADSALAALDGSSSPRAATIAAAVRRSRPP
jgi:hypothetical protein